MLILSRLNESRTKKAFDSLPLLMRCLLILMFVLLATFVIVLCGIGGWVQTLVSTPEEKFSTLKSLGVAMGGTLLAVQAMNSYKRARAIEQAAKAQGEAAKAQGEAAKAQGEAAKAQAKANENAEKRLRQEQLRTAIEHLGHKSDSVRLGGAYELFHLARKNENPNEITFIFDILCAHIRLKTNEREYQEAYKSSPSEEIQSLLNLLFVQKHEVFKGFQIKLQGSWLNGAELSGAFLYGANLTSSRLQEASLKAARLLGSSLKGARLQCANLREAHLQGAVLFEASLQGARMEKASLQGAVLGRAGLQYAKLEEAQFQGAKCQMDSYTFQERIRESADRKSLRDCILKSDNKDEFNNPIFEGGLLSEEDRKGLIKDLSDENADELGKALTGHAKKTEVGEPLADLLVKGSDNFGTYDKEQAERWIAEYEAAMAEVPPKDIAM